MLKKVWMDWKFWSWSGVLGCLAPKLAISPSLTLQSCCLLVSVCLARVRAFWVEERVRVGVETDEFRDMSVNIESLRVIQLAFGLFLCIYY